MCHLRRPCANKKISLHLFQILMSVELHNKQNFFSSFESRLNDRLTSICLGTTPRIGTLTQSKPFLSGLAQSSRQKAQMKKGFKLALFVFQIKERLRLLYNRHNLAAKVNEQRIAPCPFFPTINAGPFNQESFILRISFGDLRS